MSRFLVAGGTGFVGRALRNKLAERKHTVTVLSRSAGAGKITWDEFNNGANFKGKFDYVVNLCGEPFLDTGLFRFTDEHKRRVEQSRIGTADTLNQYVKSDDSVKRFIQITGVGAYPYQPPDLPGDRRCFGGIPKPFTEESDALSRRESFKQQGFRTDGKHNPTDYGGGHYFHTLVHDWEQAAHGERTTIIRSGVVLGNDGGALKTQLLIYKLGLGARLGGTMVLGREFSGQQFFPWIHVEDMARLIVHAAENDENLKLLNGVAPQPIKQLEFNDQLKWALNRPSWFPPPPFDVVPEWLIKIMLGEDRAYMLTRGMQVLPKAVLDSGFEYKFDTINVALRDLCS